MVKGDTGVLKRIERESRHADRAQRRLQKALVKRAVAKGRAVPAPLVATLVRHDYFARDAVEPSGDVGRYRRRIGGARGRDGHRLFYAAEVGNDLDRGGSAVVVAPRSEQADPQQAVEEAKAADGAWSPSTLALFRTEQNVKGLVFSGVEGNGLVQARAYLPRNGPPIFFLGQTGLGTAPPSSFKLDRELCASLQRESLKVLGFQECA